MNNNDYREITEDDVTTVSTDQKEEMNGQERVNDTPDVSENEKETVQAEVTNSDVSDEKEPEYEDICYICRRPEHIAGKMIKIPNNICICQDCMQKTFDSMNQTGFSMDDMLNMNMGKMPNISMINLSDLQGMQGFIPNNQKIKKKKPKEKKPVANSFIYQDLEEKMKSVFGTKVSIASKGKGKGKIEIEYYSDDELEHLFDMMMSIKRGE